MKLTATIVLSIQARSLGDAGTRLDELLAAARDDDEIELKSVDLQTPGAGPPVTLPPAAVPPSPPPAVPHPWPDGRQ